MTQCSPAEFATSFGRFLRPLFGIAGALVLATTSLHGQIYNESGDAGQTLGSAQATGATSGALLTTINGNISGINDADLYFFTITSPTTFSASTVNGVTGLALDTALFLFNSLGAPIVTNDDSSGLSLQAALPASGFTMVLAPGTYYLGISLSGNEPINLSNQLLFAPYPGGDSTALRGPAGGINPNALSNFNSLGSFAQSGAYQINLTGSATAAVPEPTSTALALAALIGLGCFAKRRQLRG